MMRSPGFKPAVRVLALVSLGACMAMASADEKVARWEAPVIDGYGYFNPLPDADFQPDPKAKYRVAFDISKGEESPSAGNKGLWHVARVVNLFGRHGKPAENLDVVVIIHGGATRSVLDDRTYRARFGTKNPDVELLDKLRGAGVKVYVCGQAIVDSGFYYQNIREGIGVALGALAAEIELGAQGYTIMSL